MVSSSVPMNVYWHKESNPGSHGGTKELVYMCLHEFEGAMFRDEIEFDAHYMGR